MAVRRTRKKLLNTRLKDVLVFLVVFNLLAIPLYIALYTDFSYRPLQELNAWMLDLTLKLFGYKSTLVDDSVEVHSNGGIQLIEISWDSTGWKSMYALVALIVATPISKLSRKTKFIVGSVALIFFLNYLRVSTTVLASIIFGFDVFDVVHTVLWREGLILSVVAIWFAWLWREKYNIRKR